MVRRTDPGNPDICPVYEFHNIYSPQAVKDQINKDCRTAAIGCIDCKKLVADRMVDQLTPIWDKRAKLTQEPSRVDEIVDAGSKRAAAVASATLREVNEAMKI